MTALIRYEIFGCDLPGGIISELTDDTLKAVFSLAKAHDLAHIIGCAIKKLDICMGDEMSALCKKQISLAAARCERTQYEYKEVCKLFENEKIPYLPLKGAIIRNYYPQAWMRTSCDIDILVHESDLERATDAMIQSLEYSFEGRYFHDIELHSPAGTNLELHFSLSEGMKQSDPIFQRVWDYSKSANKSYRFDMSPEFMIFHVIAHMAYHFVNGGCGIRPFIDLKLLNDTCEHDAGVLSKLLENAKLTSFARHANNLAEFWFGGKEADNITDDMQKFIACAGVYGNVHNVIAVKQARTGGKFKYAVSRIWLPFNSLKLFYPSLEKHKWLYPLYQVRRWTFHLFGNGKKHGLAELNINNSISQERQEATKRLLKELELM